MDSPNKIAITDDAQWHALRAKTIGGSEVGALFGLSPYGTALTLWGEKTGKVPRDPLQENDKMRWGKMLEPLVAGEVARKLGWTLKPAKTFYTSPTVPGMSCTLDFDVVDHEWGPGIVETKVVFEYADYKELWNDDRAPPYYEFQVQQQLAVTGLKWNAICVWIAQTATLCPALIRRPNEKVIGEIETRITKFWKAVESGEMPAALGTEAEFDMMKHLWPKREPLKIVTDDDPELTSIVQLYQWATEQEPGIKDTRARNKALILGAARDAELLRVPGFDVDIKQAKNKAITLTIRENPNNGVVARKPVDTTQAG